MSTASNDDSNDTANKAVKPRATDKANEATWDNARHVRRAIARKRALAT
jgi:hypothetical protein